MSNESESNKKPVVKKIVKKTVKKPVKKFNEKILSRKIIVDTDGIRKEVIRSEYTDENGVKKISVKKIKIKDNPKIKSATEVHENFEESNKEKTSDSNTNANGIKKVNRKKSQEQKFWEKYGVSIIFTIVFAIIYGSWLYIAPLIISFKVTDLSIDKFLRAKFGMMMECSRTSVYTTPTLGVGVRINNPKVYFGTSDDAKSDDTLYFKAKNVTMEIQAIPYLMKTVKFNKFIIRNLNAAVYQDENGKFAYVGHIKNSFNPQMKKIMVYVPDVELKNYAFKKYSDLTEKYQVDSGLEGNIKASVIKEVLQQSNKVTDVMLR
ncbi:MAG: hypothetical protein ACI37Z_07685 [Candidatus Gastranaerophilaceae bacterium]